MPARAAHIQLVWDQGGAGTAQSGSGSRFTVGPDGEWTAEQLLLASVESSLMSIFLRLAEEEGLAVMAFVSAAAATTGAAGGSIEESITIRPCVVVACEACREKVGRLLELSAESSSVVRALRGPVRIEAEVIVLESAGEA